MKKLFISLITILLLCTLFAVFLPKFYVLPGSTYEGKSVGGSRSELPDRIASIEEDKVMTITGYEDYQLSTRLGDIADIICVVPNEKFTYSDWFFQRPIKPVISYDYDKDKIKKYIENSVIECKDAYINFTGTEFRLEREQYGFEPEDIDAMVDFIASADDLSLDVSSLCKKPKVTSTALNNYFSKVNWLNDFKITYTSGDVFDISCLLDCLPDAGDCTSFVKTFDIESLQPDKKFMDKLADSYNTKESSLNFTTSNEASIVVPYNTFGVKLLESKEKEFIIDTIQSKESVDDRTPFLSGYDEFDDTYIEVSIDDQHLWYYSDGKLVSESPVVTGAKGRHDTPTGVFYVSECIPGKYLVGTGYRTWVNRWMRLNNNGIGLHDAGWRGSFGKKIYTYSGSHGCINLPKNYAYDLYKSIYVGIPVVVY